MAMIHARLAILKAAEHEVGVREHGANNHGPKVQEYQTHDSLPGSGYAWCNSFVDFCMDVSGCEHIAHKLGRSASVELTFHNGVNLGWYRAPGLAPQPGWLVVYTFSHIGIVKDPAQGSIETIEGNTGPTGAVSDSKGGGDGVYDKIRSTSLVRGYIAIPGEVDDAMVRRFTADKDPRVVAHTNDESYWQWLRWWLGEGEYAKYRPHDPHHRPAKLPARVPDAWQKRKEKFVMGRKATA